MKKILALALAASVVSSFGTTAFAVHTIGVDVSVMDPTGYLLTKGEVDAEGGTAGNQLPYGDTIYFPLVGAAVDPSAGVSGAAMLSGGVNTLVFAADPVKGDTGWVSAPVGATTGGTGVAANNAQLVFESDAVDGFKIKADWDMGGDLVEGVDIVKKKVAPGSPLVVGSADVTQRASVTGGAQSYAYFVAVELKENLTETDEDFVSGTLEFNKKAGESKIRAGYTGAADLKLSNIENVNSGDAYVAGDYIEFYDIKDVEIEVSFDVKYDDDDTQQPISNTKTTYEFDPGDEDDELEIFDDDVAIFTVDTIGQDDIVLFVNNDNNPAVARAYPGADINFLTLNGASFHNIGELVIYGLEDVDNFLYYVNADGTLTDSGIEYDESEGAFIIRTRTLGAYAISTTELDVLPAVDEEEEETPEVPEVPEVGTPETAPGTGTIPDDGSNPNPGTGAIA